MGHGGSSRFTRVVSTACLVYLMLRPVGHNEVLLPVLALLAAVSVGALLVGRRRASLEVVAVVALVVAVGLFGSAVGAANPGVANGMLVWLVAPLIFGAWALSADEKMLGTILRASAWATIVLAGGIALYVGGSLGVIPQLIPLAIIEETGAGFGSELGGATAIRLYGLSTLAAAGPMWVTAALLPTHPLLPRRGVALLAGGLAIVAALVAGRNAILVVLVIVPVLVWLVVKFARRTRKPTIHPAAVLGALVAICSAAFVIPVVGANPAIQRTTASVLAFFSNDAAAGADQAIRLDQADRLIRAWGESPFIGHGLGAVIHGFARDPERPWNFEMQYHLLLFQVGLIGALLLVGVLIAAGIAVTRAARARPDLNTVIIIAVTAAVGMIIANATNPYLQAPGHMWAVYLPLMVANIALLSKAPAPVVHHLSPGKMARSL